MRNFGPFINVRRFASRGDNEDDVYEVVSRQRDESRYGEIWKGEAEVELQGYVNDELQSLSVEQVLGGYYYTLYFRVSKTVLVDKIRKQVEKVIGGGD